MKLTKLFIGGFQEIKRPVNVVDDSLVQRIEEVGRRLRAEGKQITPVIGRRPKNIRLPTGIVSLLQEDADRARENRAEWPLCAANEPFDTSYHASSG